MNYNELPRAKMRKVTIAFDVDGTLRSNETATCQEPNIRIVELFKILSTFKNTELYIWSGGGEDYAKYYAKLYDLPVKEKNCISKFDDFEPDIAIDDMHETDLGKINLKYKNRLVVKSIFIF